MTINTAKVKVDFIAYLESALDLTTAKDQLANNTTFTFTNGTGANQANNTFHDTRTLTASSSEEHDLAGGLTNAFGASLTFTKIKAILVKAAAGNTNDVQVGGSATNGFESWVGATGDFVAVKPGGLLLLVAPDATGYAVTAGTGDLLKIANSAGGTSVTYDILILGAE